MSTFVGDIRYSLRMLVRSPGFTAVAVLSLALGIGANTAIFSLINGILYKSLPVRNPHELRAVTWTGDMSRRTMRSFQGPGRVGDSQYFPYSAYQDFAQHAPGFSDMFAFSCPTPLTISVGGEASLANVQMVSGDFFQGYGTRTLIGRPIAPEDDRRDAPPVAVLTYPFWQRVYGLDPQVLGHTLTVNKTIFTVIGVLPRRHAGPSAGERRTDLYVPMMVQPRLGDKDWLSSSDAWWVQLMGRLASRVDEPQAQSSLEVLFSQVLNRSTVEIDRPGILLQ